MADSMAERIKVSLSYAPAPGPDANQVAMPILRALDVDAGTTIGQAIELSGILQEAPEINLVTMPVGIYGKKKTLDTVLQPRDRIEIYRALIADPKDARRRRAKRDSAS
ncbi:RnfH family protein [Pseudoduganella albidiflava]|nr:RnfH family protein [Pseudoduganella albidiflava]